ncbi:hypothetical protein ASE35_14110 [Lysobacter sp. Root916]|uniref:restriction endonuclease n=1 Tax=Lysobacter sp. Root916 TaxID=1736606 RepID=UPI00070D163C|nr:restriction endonuclease [Lysobacter sp. Root916]KRD32082.1 hypothetical protein ASE35_14110 [Lysobacter sp. Root916]
MTKKHIAAEKIRYVKLGKGGEWESDCAARGILRMGFETADPYSMELALAGRWEEFSAAWAKDRKSGVATRYAGEVREYFEDDGTTLWVTFIDDRLHWGFLAPGNPQVNDPDNPEDSSTFRKVRGGWRDADINGRVLAKSSLPGTISSLSSYRGTSCWVHDERRLLARINAVQTPEVTRAEAAHRELIAAAVPLIQKLQPAEFETLIDMLFNAGGWRRIGAIGGQIKTKDLDLEHPIHKERAFVQVKSEAKQKVFDEYMAKLKSMTHYDRMYFVYHTSGKPLICDDPKVTLLGAGDVAQFTIDQGFMGWLIEMNL